MGVVQEAFEEMSTTWIVGRMQIQIFYNRLNLSTKQMLDVTAEGSLCSKWPDAAQILIGEIVTNGYQWSSERNKPSRVVGIYKVDALTTLATQVEVITKIVNWIQL